jgi:hypothetical protein
MFIVLMPCSLQGLAKIGKIRPVSTLLASPLDQRLGPRPRAATTPHCRCPRGPIAAASRPNPSSIATVAGSSFWQTSGRRILEKLRAGQAGQQHHERVAAGARTPITMALLLLQHPPPGATTAPRPCG